MLNTSQYFDLIIEDCFEIFRKKMIDYGSAWRILRLKSLTDQIFIKAQRIRNIDDKGSQKISEGIDSETAENFPHSCSTLQAVAQP